MLTLSLDPDTEKTALFAASCAATLAFFETVQAEDTGVSFITVTAPNSCPFAFNASGAVVQHDDTSSDVGDPKVRLVALALPFSSNIAPRTDRFPGAREDP